MAERGAGGHREEVGGGSVQAGRTGGRETSLELHERGKKFQLCKYFNKYHRV